MWPPKPATSQVPSRDVRCANCGQTTFVGVCGALGEHALPLKQKYAYLVLTDLLAGSWLPKPHELVALQELIAIAICGPTITGLYRVKKVIFFLC